MTEKKDEMPVEPDSVAENQQNPPDEDNYDYEESELYNKYYPPFLYIKTLEEEISVDIRANAEDVDEYWEKGWMIDFCDAHRVNFDSYQGLYYKAFPSRIRLSQFELTKSLRRVLQRNSDLKTVIRPLRITPEKMKLHERHYVVRYGEVPRKSLLESYKYLKHQPSDVTELCIFKNNQLLACSIFEIGNRAIVTNQAFYAIGEAARSLGTLTILLEIQYARHHGMKFYYMGNYYTQNPNYQYKARFQGFELMDWKTEKWIRFQDAGELLKEKLPLKR